MKKKHKVTSQYINPDRLIDTLRKRIETILGNSVKTLERFQEHRKVQVANAPKPIIFWKKGSFNEQNLLALTPDELHVGVIIQEVGRVVQVVEKFDDKGQPTTTFKYELTRTNLVPSVLKTGHELKEVKTQ